MTRLEPIIMPRSLRITRRSAASRASSSRGEVMAGPENGGRTIGAHNSRVKPATRQEKSPGAADAPGQSSRSCGEVFVQQGEEDEQDEAGAEAPADQLLLDGKQRLGVGFLQFAFDVDLGHRFPPKGSAGERRLDAAEEDPGDQEPTPDHEAEQADEVDRGELAEAVLPELPEVGEDADREEGQDKEDDAEMVCLRHRRGE